MDWKTNHKLAIRLRSAANRIKRERKLLQEIFSEAGVEDEYSKTISRELEHVQALIMERQSLALKPRH